jgi:hypothetical protein
MNEVRNYRVAFGQQFITHCLNPFEVGPTVGALDGSEEKGNTSFSWSIRTDFLASTGRIGIQVLRAERRSSDAITAFLVGSTDCSHALESLATFLVGEATLVAK